MSPDWNNQGAIPTPAISDMAFFGFQAVWIIGKLETVL
jgi:hypothetical protein